MQVTDITINGITDIKKEISDEYDYRRDADDLPTGQERAFYSNTHRVSLDIQDANGEHMTLEANPSNEALLSGVDQRVKDALHAEGVSVGDEPWRFSPHAGCGMCPCSPGFLLDRPDFGRQCRVAVTVTVE